MVGAPTRPRFSLINHFGNAVSESDFDGPFKLVYFGFTSCRVVCPRALAKLSAILESLGDEYSARLRPLFITVDPQRDTSEAVRHFLETSYPAFLGLTGLPESLDEARQAFRVFAQRKADPCDPDGYQIAHTAMSYLLDGDGNYLEHFSDTAAPDKIRERLLVHLRQADKNF